MPIRAFVFLLLILTLVSTSPAAAIVGATDRVPAATLLVPFFETGVDSATHPHDTLLVVENALSTGLVVHYHVWDIDGTPTELQGNVLLAERESWDAALRDLINAASPAARAQLTVGPFYRGLVTFDVVTAPTSLTPWDGGYPFGSSNALQGFIYYTRLSQGSANGLAMVPLESTPGSTPSQVRHFYGNALDGRERINELARLCSSDPSCLAGTATDGAFDRINLRIFRSTPLNGTSRAIVFLWDGGRRSGGPSVLCDELGCPSSYLLEQLDGDGELVQEATIRLDHVVNVIEDEELLGARGGWLSIVDVANVQGGTQVYAFSFNSASPAGNPNLTWDAIFEGYIVP